LDADAQAADLLHEYETKIKAGSDHPMSWSAPRNTRIATPSELSKPPPLAGPKPNFRPAGAIVRCTFGTGAT
jgi:hypothetical protein